MLHRLNPCSHVQESLRTNRWDKKEAGCLLSVLGLGLFSRKAGVLTTLQMAPASHRHDQRSSFPGPGFSSELSLEWQSCHRSAHFLAQEPSGPLPSIYCQQFLVLFHFSNYLLISILGECNCYQQAPKRGITSRGLAVILESTYSCQSPDCWQRPLKSVLSG